jgi:hypothetical protein
MNLKERLNLREANVYSEYCQKIADELAIGFAEWLLIISKEDIIYHVYSNKDLLEIYKKERDL